MKLDGTVGLACSVEGFVFFFFCLDCNKPQHFTIDCSLETIRG